MRVQFCNVRRCDTKAFMKAICDDNNISLDGQVWRTSLSAGKGECQPQEHVCCELETGSAQWH